MSIRSFFLGILIACLAFGYFVDARPAQSGPLDLFGGGSVAAAMKIVQAIEKSTADIITAGQKNICQATVGDPNCNGNMKKDQVGKANGTSIDTGGGNVRSLREIEENSRESIMDMLSFNEQKASERDALFRAQESNLKKAQANVDWMQDTKKMTVEKKSEFEAADAIACEKATVQMSTNAADVQAKDVQIALADERIRKSNTSTSASEPKSNKGRSEGAWNRFQYAKALGVIDPTGNDGANKELGVEAGPLVNSDVNAPLWMSNTAVSKSPDKRTYKEAGRLFLENVSAEDTNPIRADRLKDMGTPEAEVFAKQRAYLAKQSVFDFGLTKMLAEREPLTAIQARNYIDKLLERAGFKSDELKEEVLGEGGTTKAGLEKAIYQIRARDPSAIIGDSVWDIPNILRGTAIASMEHSALLFELIQTIQASNVILGAIGNVQLESTLGQELDIQLNNISVQ